MDLGQQSLLTAVSRFHGPVRSGLEVVLCVALAIMGARIIWLIAEPGNTVATYVDRPLPSPMQGATTAISVAGDRSLLLSQNPFDEGAVEEILDEVPETNLNLKLGGLRMSGEGGAAGNAIIQTPDGVGKNYQVGSEILPGVTLERILTDRVIINRDGATETLMLGGRGAGLSVISDDSRAVSPAASASGASSPASGGSQTIIGRVAGPDVLFAAMRAQPLQDGGRVLGYRLSAQGDPALMRQAGFEPGDLLLSLDGNRVGELDVEEVFDRLAGSARANLVVERDGTERTIRLEFGE